MTFKMSSKWYLILQSKPFVIYSVTDADFIIHVCGYCVCMRVSVWKEVGFVHNVFVVICHWFAYNPYDGYICAIKFILFYSFCMVWGFTQNLSMSSRSIYSIFQASGWPKTQRLAREAKINISQIFRLSLFDFDYFLSVTLNKDVIYVYKLFLFSVDAFLSLPRQILKPLRYTHATCTWTLTLWIFFFFLPITLNQSYLTFISRDSSMVEESPGSFQLYRDLETPCETTATTERTANHSHIPRHHVPSWTQTYTAEVCS